MRCKHCTLEIERIGERYFHVSGLFWCMAGDTYAEPVSEGEARVESEKKFFGAAAGLEEEKVCGCGEGAKGCCENCGVALCKDCDTGHFVDVMTCRDTEACEKRLRRKAVADASRCIFPGAELA